MLFLTSPSYRLDCPERDLFETLPDDIVVNILCRLSIDQILRCRAVCKRWRYLTATDHFIRYHCDKGSSVSGILSWLTDRKYHLLYPHELSKKNKWEKMIRLTRFSLPNDPRMRLRASCNGFLVFKTSCAGQPHHFIYNPITHERVTLRDLHGVLGFFYNSLTRKYGFLCMMAGAGGAFLYYIYYYHTRSYRYIGTFRYAPRPDDDYMTILNFGGRLYWIARLSTPCRYCIIVFEADTEKLLFMPHPRASCQYSFYHFDMHLLEMEGRLCCAQISDTWTSIKIWVLEDYKNWLWVEHHNVNLRSIVWTLWQYPIIVILQYLTFESLSCEILPLGIQDQELILAWSPLGIVKYHLKHRKFCRVEGNQFCDIIVTPPYLLGTSFKMSFASLSNLQL